MSTADKVILRVRDLLKDSVVPYRWSDTHILRVLTDAQRELAAVIPESTATVHQLPLVPGYVQTLPAGAARLLRVMHNGTQAAPGRAVTVADPEVLHRADPVWTYTAGDGVVLHYMQAPEKNKFWVYPTIPGTGSFTLTLLYSALPGEVATGSTSLVTAVDYDEPLAFSTASKLLAEDGDAKGNIDKSEFFYGKYLAMVGLDKAQRGEQQARGVPA